MKAFITGEPGEVPRSNRRSMAPCGVAGGHSCGRPRSSWASGSRSCERAFADESTGAGNGAGQGDCFWFSHELEAVSLTTRIAFVLSAAVVSAVLTLLVR
jgi:hypothetical protein